MEVRAMSKRIEYPEDWSARRVAVLFRDGYTCQECGAQARRGEMHIDHVTSAASGGGHEIENLRALCADCHADRHDRRLCEACSLFAQRRMDVVSDSGTGTVHLCRGHHDLLRYRQADDDIGVGDSFSGHAGAGRCAFCLDDTDGRYCLADRDYNEGGVRVCLDCRHILAVRDGASGRAAMADRIVERRG